MSSSAMPERATYSLLPQRALNSNHRLSPQFSNPLLRSYREPVIAHLVDELDADKEMLDRLERMIEAKRRRQREQ